MKVLHCSQYYWPFIGGAEVYCQKVSEGLVGKSDRVDLITSNVTSIKPLLLSDKPTEFHNGVRIRRVASLPKLNTLYGNKEVTSDTARSIQIFNTVDSHNFWPLALGLRTITSAIPLYFPELLKEAKNHQITVAFNSITGLTALTFTAAKAASVPLIIFPMFHFGLPTYERPSIYHMLQRSDAVICSTAFEKIELVRRGVSEKKTHVVYEGIDAPNVEKAFVDEFRQKYGLGTGGQFVVSYIGRRDFDKGYLHVLRATALLAKQVRNLRLLVSGYGVRGTNLPEYQDLAKSNTIIDLGVTNEKTKLAAIACSDVIALPSRAETYPIVFVEAWFMAKPIIGARIGSVASVVREGIDGYLVQFGDTEALADAILRLYKDRDLSSRMGKEAKTRAEKEFHFVNKIRQIRQIYENTAKKDM